jgi:hypothetical protein
MQSKLLQMTLLLAAVTICPRVAWAEQPSASTKQDPFILYSQKKYAAAANIFETLIRTQPSAHNCYFAAMSNRANHEDVRAEQLLQYVVKTYPKCPEAFFAKKQLATAPKARARTTASSSYANSQYLPDKVNSLIPKDTQKPVNTPTGQKGIQQVMPQQADQPDTIRQAEATKVLPKDQVQAPVESTGTMPSHPQTDKDNPSNSTTTK